MKVGAEAAPFDLERAIQSDFEGAIERLDVEDLRAFLRDAAKRDIRTGDVSFAMALVEFAARKLSTLSFCQDDPTLDEDAERWSRSAKRKAKADISGCSSLLTRARRLYLKNRASQARRCYETVLSALADIEIAHAQISKLAPDLLAPLVFGSYLVSVYEDTPAAERVEATLDAVVRLSVLGSIAAPLRLMEEMTVRPLDDFNAFTRAWARTLETHAEESERVVLDPSAPSEALLAEALERLEGIEGVARMARRSRDLAHYRTWIVRLADQSQWSAALGVVEEADSSLADPVDRGIALDAGVGLATRSGDLRQAAELAERAFVADPTLARLLQWLLVDEPDHERLRARASRARHLGADSTPRMRALLCAVLGQFGEVAALLDESDDHWDDEGHPGRLAFPTLLIAFYGGPKGTPIASKLCATLFGVRPKTAEGTPEDWEPPSDPIGRPAVPNPGPAIVSALREVDREHAADLESVPAVLRAAAARRAGAVLASKDRDSYENAALLVVAAAEATFRAGDHDTARAYLGEIAQTATRHSTFRSALTRTLGKSALVNAL